MQLTTAGAVTTSCKQTGKNMNTVFTVKMRFATVQHHTRKRLWLVLVARHGLLWVKVVPVKVRQLSSSIPLLHIQQAQNQSWMPLTAALTAGWPGVERRSGESAHQTVCAFMPGHQEQSVSCNTTDLGRDSNDQLLMLLFF